MPNAQQHETRTSKIRTNVAFTFEKKKHAHTAVSTYIHTGKQKAAKSGNLGRPTQHITRNTKQKTRNTKHPETKTDEFGWCGGSPSNTTSSSISSHPTTSRARPPCPPHLLRLPLPHAGGVPQALDFARVLLLAFAIRQRGGHRCPDSVRAELCVSCESERQSVTRGGGIAKNIMRLRTFCLPRNVAYTLSTIS